MKSFPYLTAFVLLVCVILLGCGKGYVPMNGRIVFSDNGEPLTQGTVIFTSNTHMARGNIRADGSYSLGTDTANDGLPPGEYTIYIVGASTFTVSSKIIPATKDSEAITQVQTISVIDPKYQNPGTSDLSLNVDGSKKTYDIKVDRNPK